MIDRVACARPRVALVFGDAASAAHLRDAVAAQVEIVYDTSARDFDAARLADSGATAALVNLDGCDWVDPIEARLVDAGVQVVFNDPEVSRSLEGWDRARWLRHLTAKLRCSVDYDPPRPAGHRDGNVVSADVVSTTIPLSASAVPGTHTVMFDSGSPGPGPDPGDDILDVDTEALSAMIDARLAEAPTATPPASAPLMFADAGAAVPPAAPGPVPPDASAPAGAPPSAAPAGRRAAEDDPFAELPALAEWQLVDPDAPVAPGVVPSEGRAQPASLPDSLANLQLVPMEAAVSVELHAEPVERWMHVEERKRATGGLGRKAGASRGQGTRGESA